MIVFWDSVLEPLLKAATPAVIVEIGAYNGDTTVKLLELASQSGCVVHCIDPSPGPKFDVAGLRDRHGEDFVFHRRTSLDALEKIEAPDAVLIDGDHNWYTVYNELKLLASRSTERGRPFPLTFLHDVDWPYGRRDLYYDPDTVPAEGRRPFRKGGIIPGRGELSELGINAGSDHSLEEHAPRTGVRTAIEDFLTETDLELQFRSVIGFHGLGILVSREQLETNAELRRMLDDFESARWLREQCQRLEESRMWLLIATRRLRLELRKAKGAKAAKAPPKR